MKLHEAKQKITDANQALDLLKAGNERYISNNLSEKNDYAEIRKSLENEQNPFAIVLCCSDSRVAPEIFFDQKLGDIFVLRNAGNIADSSAQGSMEYAISQLKAPLMVVCGHTSCGAVGAAFTGFKASDHLNDLISKIKTDYDEKPETAEDLGVLHIEDMVNEVKNNPVIKEHGTKVIGALYNIKTGEVSFI